MNIRDSNWTWRVRGQEYGSGGPRNELLEDQIKAVEVEDPDKEAPSKLSEAKTDSGPHSSVRQD